LDPFLNKRGMEMSKHKRHVQETQHAFLVVWGQYAQEIGLLDKLEAVKLRQKTYQHTPQRKVLEFLASTLMGLKHLQDISLAAHPLDKDQAAAEAWGQAAWADYTGISRTLSGLSWAEVNELAGVLQAISQPFLEAETQRLRTQGKRLRLDGDLTGLPVSNTSKTYPQAAFGYMGGEIRLGYQASVVSLESPTYQRLWLSVEHHPGDTVSCTQAEALALAAEDRLGLRPRRRTELLSQRIQAFEAAMRPTKKRLKSQQDALETAQVRLEEAKQQILKRKQVLAELESVYQSRQRPERPTSKLAQARKRLQASLRRGASRENAYQLAKKRLEKTEARLSNQQAELAHLQQRLQRFEQENADNPDPLEAEFRLDAGFGTYENIALLIEMGYQVYTKPQNHKVVSFLCDQISENATWTPVGANAEMTAWHHLRLENCPYPLDVAVERFHTGKTIKHSALFHFGDDPVTDDLGGWFEYYNGRQTIEAGIKEGKQVFYLHRIKVRSEPAIYLQECFVLFAANFIRWASHWVTSQAQIDENALDINRLGIKRQVKVAAHVSASVVRDSEGMLLKFSPHSAFAGKVLRLSSGAKSPPTYRSFFDVLCRFLPLRI
jgi:hypothetical protein